MWKHVSCDSCCSQLRWTRKIQHEELVQRQTLTQTLQWIWKTAWGWWRYSWSMLKRGYSKPCQPWISAFNFWGSQSRVVDKIECNLDGGIFSLDLHSFSGYIINCPWFSSYTVINYNCKSRHGQRYQSYHASQIYSSSRTYKNYTFLYVYIILYIYVKITIWIYIYNCCFVISLYIFIFSPLPCSWLKT